jgi:hypothetical protein
VLRVSARIESGQEQQKTLEDLKLYLEHLPTLSSLEQGHPLILYVSTMHLAVSGALVVEKEITRDGKIKKRQLVEYFVSEILIGSKKYYSEMEKICYAVIMSTRKLRPYFEAHTIKVLTNQPLNDIFGNRDSSGRINKWVIELSEYMVDFEKRSPIKSQILVDFVAEWTEPSSSVGGTTPEWPWLIYCDKAWGNSRAGATVILILPSGIKLHYAARLQFTKCNTRFLHHKIFAKLEVH